jgi:hypothetical protein
MDKMMKQYGILLTAFGVLLSPAVFAQYSLTYSTNGGAIAVTGYTGTPVAVALPDFVSVIGSDAFNECGSITRIAIGINVTNIEDAAFAGCSNLAGIVIPKNVGPTLQSDIFAACTSLKSIVIPNSVSSIGPSVFTGCTGLTNVVIPTVVGTARPVRHSLATADAPSMA